MITSTKSNAKSTNINNTPTTPNLKWVRQLKKLNGTWFNKEADQLIKEEQKELKKQKTNQMKKKKAN